MIRAGLRAADVCLNPEGLFVPVHDAAEIINIWRAMHDAAREVCNG